MADPINLSAVQSSTSSNGINVNFTDNSGFSGNIWIGFWSTDDGTNITKSDGTPIQRITQGGKWYALSDLQAGVIIHTFVGGQIYVQYGGDNGWQPTAGGGKPSPVNPGDPAYLFRYDFVELTVTPAPADVADLTVIDSWSIPFTIKSFKNGVEVDTLNALKDGITPQSFYDSLTAISTPPQSGVDQAVPADVWNGTDFVRVIGPTAYPVIGGLPAIPYDLFESYLQRLFDTNGTNSFATIKGTYGGDENQTPPLQNNQTYDLKATLDADLNLTLTGTCSSAGNTTMIFDSDALINAPGIYGGNVPFNLNGDPNVSPANNVYGWICGDLFTGLTVGAIGSTTVVGGQEVGSMNSEDWFILTNKAMAGNYFDKLQSNPKFYNQWAAAVYANTNAYGYAYAERYSGVHLSLNQANMDTMEIILMPATITKT